MNDSFDKAMAFYLSKKYEESFRLFSLGAEQGDPRCVYGVGSSIYNGKGTEKDEKKGMSIVLNNMNALEECGKNNIKGSNRLLYLAYSCFDFLDDDVKRFEALDRLYNHQKNELFADALFDYAQCFNNERGTTKNIEKAHSLFNECYENYNHLKSLLAVANYYIYDLPFYKQNIDCAIEILKKGAEADKTEQQDFRRELFNIYFGVHNDTDDKIGKNIDYILAEQTAIDALQFVKYPIDIACWNLLLFMTTSMQGKTDLSNKYLEKVNFEEFSEYIASIWVFYTPAYCNEITIKRAEQMNNSILKKLIGYDVNPFYIMHRFYEFSSLRCNSSKTKNDLEDKSLQLLKKGVSNKEDVCMYLYSNLLITGGDRVNKDVFKGFELLKKCCCLTRDYTCFLLLGWCYENGIGVSIDKQEAYRCYKKTYTFDDFSEQYKSFNYSYKTEAALHILFVSNYICLPKEELKEYWDFLLSHPYNASISSLSLYVSEINKVNPKFLIWIANHSYEHYKEIGPLAKCYRYGIGTVKNVKRAIQLYEEDDSYFRSEYLCEIGKIYYYGDELEKDIELAEKYFIESNSDSTKCFIRDSLIYLFHIYSDKKNYKYDLQKALNCLLEATKENKDNDIKLGDAFYLLGQFYQTKDYGMYNLELAKKYYEKAKEHDLNCDYAIESINRDILISKYYEEGVAEAKKEKIFREQELKDFAKKYARDKYANSTGKGLYSSVNKMLHMGVNGEERIKYIENELQDDFRSVWSDLRDNAKKSLVTTTYLYSTLIEMGYEGYKDMDFSSIVNGFSKAFEIELKLFLSTGLLKFLKANKINHEEFVNEAAKQQLPFIEKEIRVEDGFPVAYYSYTEEEESKSFSLGQVRYIVTIGYENQFLNTTLDKNREKNGVRTRTAIMSGATVNEHIIDYFDELFDDDVFSSVNRKKEIANYLIDLANDVKIIQERRNPSTHEKSMTIDEAELCADYLVKSRNLMYDFLIKLKKKYRQGYFIKKTR